MWFAFWVAMTALIWLSLAVGLPALELPVMVAGVCLLVYGIFNW